MQTRHLSFMQISDCHLMGKGKLYNDRYDATDLLSRLMEGLYRLLPSPDFILVSGDISEDGSSESYQTFLDLTERFSCPIFPCVGNHDSKSHLIRAFPDFDWDKKTGQFADRCCGMNIYALNTSRGDLVDAYLDEARLMALETYLSGVEGSVLLMMHHPLFPPEPFFPMPPYMEQDRLEAILKAHADKIAGIFSGHHHRAISGSVAGIPVIVAPSTTVQFSLFPKRARKSLFTAESPGCYIHSYGAETGLISTAFLEETAHELERS